MDTLRFPIRFSSGNVENLAEGSDAYYAQLLALAAQIKPGELPLTPEFGCEDPVFDRESRDQLALTAAYFVPEVAIESLDIAESDSGESQIKITFSVRE